MLQREYGALPKLDATDSEPERIDYAFIQNVWETRATTFERLLFWSMIGKVLESALRQLDSHLLGMAITVAQLMPPSADGRIHSLREVAGRASSPWSSNLEHHMLFLGAESLAGHVVSHGRTEFIDDLRVQTTLLPVYQMAYEVSAAAYPIMYANRVAGCLVCSSTQPEYFHPAWRRALIQDYTWLLAPAFPPDHFFEIKQIELRLMPPPEVQYTQFVTFQRRVIALMKEAYKASDFLTRPQAEQLVWQQLEEELLRF